MIEKFSIIEDFSNTVLLVEVKVVGDDLTFVYADGREFKFSLNIDYINITNQDTQQKQKMKLYITNNQIGYDIEEE